MAESQTKQKTNLFIVFMALTLTFSLLVLSPGLRRAMAQPDSGMMSALGDALETVASPVDAGNGEPGQALSGLAGAGEFKPAPAFSVPLGETKPEAIGTSKDEAKIIHYDRFWFPAAFLVFEADNLVVVLDSGRDRLARFSTDGKYLGEVKLSFPKPAIDFAFFPAARRMFFALQDSPDLGILHLGGADGWTVEKTETLRVCESNIQRVWALSPTGDPAPAKCAVMVQAMGEKDENLVVMVESPADAGKGKIKILARLDDQGQAAAVPQTGTILGLMSSEPRQWQLCLTGAPWQTGEVLPVDQGMLPMGDPGKLGCRFLRPAGGDGQGNLYLEGFIGVGDDAITEAWVYRLNGNGKFLGRGRVPIAPEMLTNRCVAIDAGGSVWYMRKNREARTVEFLKTRCDEQD